ncbi:microtubule-actin cross-linking factor 1 isoform X21 [Amblyraja radiata]|uniref:microtubule-actin cross-linking factor 1 isoform X21 n=1 Tax=Amblyraja radiata TaxID=386614 RepID=UPI00140404F8|nr:microtubule-actin cross-linking factor 1 isoform X21 [Amblyraja radiata]
MGSTLGCVRKQREAAGADGKQTPLTPRRRKIKFKRFRRNRKRDGERGEAKGEQPGESVPSATVLLEAGETRLPSAVTAGKLTPGSGSDPRPTPGDTARSPSPPPELHKPARLRHLSHLPSPTEKSIDLNAEAGGEGTQQVLSAKPVDEHATTFSKDVSLHDQIPAPGEHSDPQVNMKGDLIFPIPVSGEENRTQSLEGDTRVRYKIIPNTPDVAAFDCNDTEDGLESPTLSRETLKQRLQLDWEGNNASGVDKLLKTVHGERIHAKNGQPTVHRGNGALEEGAQFVRLKRGFTVEPQTCTTLFSSGYGSNLATAEINESESGRTSSRDFESSSIPDGDILSLSENELGFSTGNECDDISLGQIEHLSQEMISEIYVSGESGDMSAKEKLLLWTQKLTEGYSGLKCSNFTSSWSDGKVFNAIIHKYRPDLIDMEKVSIQSNQENLEQAFAVAESLGVTRLLDPEDVDVPSPDEKSVLTYVSSIYESFPKVPEGGEGITANEVDSKWEEYQDKVNYLFQWIRQHIRRMSDKAFPHNPVELKALYNEYVHFKETELPAKELEKAQIQHLYKLFEVWIEFGRFMLPQGFHPNDVEEEWGKLIFEMLDREKALRPAVERLELLLQIANKIQNGALNCEEKLTLAKNTLQADATHLESGQQFHYETEVVMYLEECERLIRQLQIDVQILRDEKYYQVEQIVMRIIKLQDELVTLRLECTNLYRKGHFISSTDHLQPLNLTAIDLTTDVGSSTLHISSLTGFKKPTTRSELIAISSTQDEGSLRFVYELLAWVEETQVKLDRAEWGTDLPNVEMQLETHRTIHAAVEELDSSLKEAKIYEGQISSNFKTSYSDTLSKLEVQYLKLLETSRLRLRHLLSLHSFVSNVTTELIWLNEKEEEELAYDWSDNNTNISTKKEYFIDLKKELEQKQMFIKSHQETGEQLSLESHPARQTVEAYSAALQTQWHWIKQLCCCVEQHVKDNTAYFQFLSDVKEAEQYLRNLQETIRRKYKCDRTSSLSKLEDLLQDSMDEKEQLIKYKSCIAGLVGRAKTIVQLKPRNPDNVLKGTIPIRAICDYRQIEPLGTMQHPSTGKVTGSGPLPSLHYLGQYHSGIGQKEITVCKNDECVLEDNSHRTKWKVISPTGNEAMVPSVCFTIPAPNQEAIDTSNRIEQIYQNVMALWHQLHLNMKSVVAWNYLVKDIETIHTWNKDTIKTLKATEQQQLMKNLRVHYEDFLEDSQESQVFSIADRLRLEEEVDGCKEHYEQLLATMETEEKDETLSKTCISELQNIHLRLGKYNDRLIRRLQASVEGDVMQENTFRIAEQEHMQQELSGLKSELNEVTKRCKTFFYQSPSAASIPVLRSELDLVVQKMDQVHSLSSAYLDKLKMVDVILKNSQRAEMLVKMYEMKLSEEDMVPVNQQAVKGHRSVLQQWLGDVKEKQEVFSSLEEEMQRAQAVCKHLFELHNERSLDLERHQEKAVQLKDRWRNIQTQIETRESELATIEALLKNYRGCHQSLIDWIEETTAQQGKMEPGKAEDTKILSEQLSQQMALVAEIENNQIKLDECQSLSKQYSAGVKDYELQLMTYRAFVESHQKSPVKRRRMHSSSDVITQEFMDLRTQYTALVTLTTQHVKYISDALRRLEEEEKIVEEEKQEHVEKMKELLGWVLNTDQIRKNKNVLPETAGLESIEQSFSEQQVITEELNAKKDHVAEAIKTTQIFLAKHGNRISPEEQQQVTSQLNTLKETYGKLCDESAAELQQLQNKLTHEVQRKTRQEQQEECEQKLDELGTWLAQTANMVASHQVAISECDLPALHEQQSAIQTLQKDMQSRAAAMEDVIKATEHLLHENEGKLGTEELAKVETKLLEVKAQHKVLSQSAEKLQKQVDSALTKAVQQETEKAKAEEELEENKVKIDGLLEWLSSVGRQTATYYPHMRPREVRDRLGEDEIDALGNGVRPRDRDDVMDTPAGKGGNLNQQQQALKEHHETLLSQQQAFVLATQSAQSFLDKHGHNLSPEERKQLQSNLNDLKEQYETALLHADSQLKYVHALQEELQKFQKDHGEFETWLIQSEHELEEIKAGEMDSDSLQVKLQKQKGFSEDVISHKGDLRYITISGQKVLDAADVFAEANANEDFKSPIDPSVTSTLVKEKLEDAKNRYSTLHSKCNKLGTHLANMLEKYQHFHDIASELNSWLENSEVTGDRLLLETISSDPESLQKHLAEIKVLQGDLAEHEVGVEKLQKAANSLMSMDDDLVPNQDQIQLTTGSITQRFKKLSTVVSEHNEKMQVSIAQSQSVQEGLDNLLNWLEGVEKSLKNQDNLPLSSAAIQDSLAQNAKLKQDIASHQSSINTIQEMVHGFIENTDRATASSLQEKLERLNSQVQAVCNEQQVKEEKLRKLLPKTEQFEKLVQDVGQFIENKSQSLAAGGDPNEDIAHFSQKILEASTEMVKQREDLQALQQLAEELATFDILTEKNQLTETVKDLTKGYKKLELNIKKREEEATSCQQSLSDFTSLVESIRKWLKETETRIPCFESALDTDTIKEQIQEVVVLLEDWSAKSPQIQEINHKGTELESLIMEITSPDTALNTSKTGSVMMNGGVTAPSMNGYHRSKELAEIQQNVSDVNHNYKILGNTLKECQDHLSATLNQMQEVEEETASIMNWLESKEQTLTSLSSSSIKTQAMKAQVEQNKVHLAELEQNSDKINKLKETLKGLLKKNPDSPEAKKWTEMLEGIESKWARANQTITQRQQKLEESADLLSTFQSTESQLSPWLSEKELMMSVLGPLSIDPNMLHAQKQQVQFMLKEFETRKPQYEQLNQAAQGILCALDDVSPSDNHVRDQHRAINDKWDNLTHQLSSRSNQIDQATAKSTEYQELLQRLSDRVRILNHKLNSQSVISTQPDIVKQQLEEISEIRSDLEQQKEQIEEAQNLCEDLSSLIGEQYLKDELRKRLDAVLLPFNGLEERAGDRINQLQTTLASSQQFQQTFDELRLWLDEKCSEHSRKPPVSANLDILQSQISEQEEFQKSLNQHSGSYEMILGEGESLVRSAQTGEEKTNLQSQLSTLKGQWDELWKQAAGRYSKLKDCVQKAQKYRQYMEELLPWIEECEFKVEELEITIDPAQLNSSLANAKDLQHDVEKHRSPLEMMNTAADILVDSCQVDEEDIRDEKTDINQRMDIVTERLQAKSESIEEMAQRLKEFQDSLKSIQMKLDGTKQQLEIYDALGPQAYSNKNLEKLRTRQESLQILESQVDYLRDLAQGLAEDAPDGADSSRLLQQAELVQQEYGSVKERVNESCLAMENRLQGIGHFQNHIREMFSHLADLDDELDSMSPIGRDLDSLQSQIDDIKQFISKLKELKKDIESSEEKCKQMLEEEGSPDLQGLKRELEALNKQCGKLLERGRNRQEQVEMTVGRVEDFYEKLRELNNLLTKTEEGEELQGNVGTEVDVINQQLANFKTFQKVQVDPIQYKLQQANGVGQGLIQSAAKNANTQGLEHDLDETNIRWNTLNKKVAERISQLQEALLHRGKFQDALEPLLSWLTDTEELIANQKPPSAEYKVVKAQIQEQKLLQRLLDDRRSTVEIIKVEGERIAESAETAEKDKIQKQLPNLRGRWDGLLSKAAARQQQLEDILVIAKQFHETAEPLNDWLTSKEKKLANSEPVGTQTAKIQQQITRHKALGDDITNQTESIRQAVDIGQFLMTLSAKPDQDMVEDKLESIQTRYREIRDKCSRKAVLLQQALANAKIFGEEEVEVLNWLADVQDKLSLVTINDYKSDILLKQHKEQLALNDDIISRKKNVDQAVKNGQALLKQTTGEEVIIIQEKLDGIKSRYAEITTSSSRALKTLEQVLQLATKFQAFNEELCGWLDAVESELAASTPQSPIGEQIPQLHERQKELKKEVMEYRLVLDTINEVSNALLELVPWRAREGLDRQVAEANDRYKTVSDTVTQKVEAIDAAIQRSQQYEQATDSELTWVAETVRKLTALGPIRLEQDQTTAQLQVQKAFTIDIIRHKDSIDELINTQDEILNTCRDEQKTALQDKMDLLQQQYEMVSQMNTERYSQLERAQVLINQFWETYEELCPWLDETRALMMQLPPPAVDHEILKQQQEEMRQLRESISEHKPHIDKLMKIGPQLVLLNPDEGRMVHEKHTTAEALYAKIKHDARERALALDEAISQSAQFAEFHDKIDPMLESLGHIADRMRMPPSIPAEVEKIREHINENKNIAMELEKLQPSFEALKRRGGELISRSSGAEEDPAAKSIQDKLDEMAFYWEDIKARGEERDNKLLDVLDLAEKFWDDMAALLTTIKDTQEIVRDLESPGIDPSIIKQQQEAAETIKEETDGLHEELEFVRILGADLIFACGEFEKPEVKKSIDELNNTWDNLNKTWKERMDKLEDAMQAAVQYQDALQAMFDWLDNTVIKLGEMSPVGTDINTVKQQINEMKEFKMEVYQQQIEMEKLNHQGELLLKKASDETDRDIIQQPLKELQHLWENLGEKIINRQHRVEGALLALGQFQHALAELVAWLNHTEELLEGQKPITGDPKAIEIELAKHHVLKNDVLAHKSTFDTVNKAGNELLESSAGEDASNLKHRLDTLNKNWQSLLRKTEGREQQLGAALQQAEGFHAEIEDFLQWLSRIENQLAVSKSTGGLPETAREQLNTHLDLYREFCANEETYKNVHDKGRLLQSSRDDAAGSNVEQCVTLLEQKWQSMSTKMEERKTKLEEALTLATEFQNSLQDFINWLTQAEQGLNIAAPPSLILDTVLFQIDEHKIFANEVNSHRDPIIDLDKTGNQLKFLSQKQDVVLIKNLLFSVQSRWEKVVQRSVERGRALDEARKRAKQFYEAWKKLIDWLEEAENNLDTDIEISNDPDKIKLQLTKHKDFQKTLGGKQPVYDTTIRMGRSMKDKASHADDRLKMDNLLGEVRDKWDTVCGKSVERQHKLEEALLFSGQFTDALQALVDWLYKVEPQLAEDQPVHGDLDLVMNLLDAHKGFQKELGKRTGNVQVLKRSARELIENSHDDTTWVKAQLQELSIRWDIVCKLSVSKQTRLEQALKQAEEFHNAVHGLLEWLSEAEQSLRFRGVLPDDVEALQSLIDLHKEFMKKVEEKRVDVNNAAGMGEAILAVCHPDCVTTVKHWITIIRARFEEVLTWAKQHQQRLATALSELVTNAELLEELLTWLQWAETTLIQRDQESMPKDIEQVKTSITEHQSFMEEMTRKQPDVDKVTKTYKRKAAEPSHARGRKNLNQMTHPPAPTTMPAQTEAKNPQINLLSGRWQQVWLLALERQRKLHDCLDRLEELKEFANFDFDVWRKKYMRWMNHKKSRVMDFFRRIDKDQDGKITRQEFIDGILSSKFPTSKLEMTAVADIFDGDGDGYIDYYEFVAALHPNKDAYRPVTDADKIEDEVTRQVAQCKCAKRFQVEQIGENKYRFFLGNQASSTLALLGFGDSQQLRLVRILRSTVMVRVGGGWMALDEFLVKNDPCRARGRTNLELREKFILPEGAPQGMAPFRLRGRKSKPSSRAASPTRSSSSASHSNHSCTSMPSSPATPASGNKTPQTFTRCYDKPWLTNSKVSTPTKCLDSHVLQIPSIEVTPVQGSKLRRPSYHSSKVSLTGDNGNSPAASKSGKTDTKRTPSRPTSRAGSRAGSGANSRRGSDASDFDVLETQSMCSDISESSTGGSQASSRRSSSKPSKIPTPSKKTTTPKNTNTRR